MTDDEFFRWVLLAGLILVLPVAIYHRVKSVTGEKLDRTQEGWVILPARIVLGIGGMVMLIAYLIDPTWMEWSSLPLPNAVRWIGVALGCMTGVLLTWTFRTLGRNLTDTVVTRKEHTLVTTGPYRWVRHPFYVSFALGVLANSLVAANWFFLLCGTIAFLVLAVRTRIEEAKLIERFGDDYRDYMKRTGRFFPRLK
jgi:protein-S-isoprenylcysteine O-methyltransferase Ste14